MTPIWSDPSLFRGPTAQAAAAAPVAGLVDERLAGWRLVAADGWAAELPAPGAPRTSGETCELPSVSFFEGGLLEICVCYSFAQGTQENGGNEEPKQFGS